MGNLADEVLSHVAAAGLKEGDRLPPERELAERLGLSRTGLRRALQDLADRGILWRHVGRGTFLGARPAAARPPDGAEAAQAPDTNPREVMAVRIMLEPALAASAAMSASTRDIERIAEAHERARDAGTQEAFELWDAAFHRAVVAAAQNRLVVQMYALIDAARSDRVWGQLKKASLTPERRRAYVADHEAIHRAIAERNAPEAERAMRDHLREVRANLLGEGG